MKFVCKKCVEDEMSDEPCILNIKGAKELKLERPDWKEALRRCPFETSIDNKLNGHAPRADWVRVKKK